MHDKNQETHTRFHVLHVYAGMHATRARTQLRTREKIFTRSRYQIVRTRYADNVIQKIVVLEASEHSCRRCSAVSDGRVTH
jgi:hypothetical protein